MRKSSKLGVYVVCSLGAFYAYTIAYMLICCTINVQPSDFMTIAFAVVTVAEIIITAYLKTGPKALSRDDVGFIAEVIGKVLNIAVPTATSGESGYRDDSEEIDNEQLDSDDADEAQQQEAVG